MRRMALKIAYIGTDFYGFQRQPGLITVEGEILSALKKVGLVDETEKCGFGIAGRTDRGVHALGNVISFLIEDRIIINQINDALPQNIRVLAQARVPLRFKARYAKSRHYRYLLINDPEIQDESDLNLEEMTEASEIFKGTHDFRNFSKRSERNPIRTIDQIQILKEGDLIRVDVIGESFLWNMVRKIVSVMLSVGKGHLKPDDIYEYFDPQKSFPLKPMPPDGLILMDVNYEGVKFTEDLYAKNKFISSLKKEYLKSQSIASAGKEMIKNLREK
jgi:tRNA pseudouridine38-40 synthase